MTNNDINDNDVNNENDNDNDGNNYDNDDFYHYDDDDDYDDKCKVEYSFEWLACSQTNVIIYGCFLCDLSVCLETYGVKLENMVLLKQQIVWPYALLE